MNVYVLETSKRLADLGVEVEVFTRATSERPAAGRRGRARASSVRHLPAGPLEGLGKEDLPSQLCALTSGVLRAEARARARLVRRRALALLAVRAGRLAGQGALGRPAGAHRAHPGQGQEPRAGRRRRRPSRCAGSSARSRSSPPPTGWSPTPPTRPASCVDLYDAEAAPRRDRQPRRRPRALPARHRLDRAHPPRRAARRRGPAVRRAPAAAEGARRAAAGRGAGCSSATRRCATGCVVAVVGGPSGNGQAPLPGRAAAAPGARRGARPAGPLRAAERRRTGCATGTARPTSSPSPRTTSRSAWSPSRRRPAAPPSSRPTSAGCAPPCATAAAACSSPGTHATPGPPPSPRALRDRAALLAAARSPTPRDFSWASDRAGPAGDLPRRPGRPVAAPPGGGAVTPATASPAETSSGRARRGRAGLHQPGRGPVLRHAARHPQARHQLLARRRPARAARRGLRLPQAGRERRGVPALPAAPQRPDVRRRVLRRQGRRRLPGRPAAAARR